MLVLRTRGIVMQCGSECAQPFHLIAHEGNMTANRDWGPIIGLGSGSLPTVDRSIYFLSPVVAGPMTLQPIVHLRLCVGQQGLNAPEQSPELSHGIFALPSHLLHRPARAPFPAGVLSPNGTPAFRDIAEGHRPACVHQFTDRAKALSHRGAGKEIRALRLRG